MAQRLSILVLKIFIFTKCAFGESAHGLVGDSVWFPVPESCKTDVTATLYRVEQLGPRLVSTREGGVCKPAAEYEDRVELTSCFAFSRTLYTDSGVYKLSCGSVGQRISLEVVYGAQVSLTEGEPGSIPCYYKTKSTEQHPDSIWWRKDKQDVLVRNLTTKDTKYGLGFENRVSLLSDGAKTGNWSLIWNQVQLQDEGVYYCSVKINEVKERWGSPAAVRLKVIRRNLNPTTPSPHLTTKKSVPEERSWIGWIALLMFMIVAALVILLCWYLQTRGCPRGHTESRCWAI